MPHSGGRGELRDLPEFETAEARRAEREAFFARAWAKKRRREEREEREERKEKETKGENGPEK
jgi:hypothetical protein